MAMHTNAARARGLERAQRGHAHVNGARARAAAAPAIGPDAQDIALGLDVDLGDAIGHARDPRRSGRADGDLDVDRAVGANGRDAADVHERGEIGRDGHGGRGRLRPRRNDHGHGGLRRLVVELGAGGEGERERGDRRERREPRALEGHRAHLSIEAADLFHGSRGPGSPSVIAPEDTITLPERASISIP
ncbi:MAG: hypothetical protein QM820_64275 [Minicystis sp.]